MANSEDEPIYDEAFENRIRQVAEQVKLAMEGLSSLLQGVVAVLELPETEEYINDKFKQDLSSIDVQELKEKAERLPIASGALDYLQTKEALTLLSYIHGRKDLLNTYAKMAIGIDKLQKFLEGRSSI
jgi:hypothetical protein